MLQIVDIFCNKANLEENIGVLDTDANKIRYYTHYEIQKNYSTLFLNLQGCEYTHTSDTGKKFLLCNSVQDISYESSLCVKYGLPDCIDYNKIKCCTLENIPVGLRIVKNNIVYSYQNSAKLGVCWHAHLFVPAYKSEGSIILEKTLFNKPVIDCSYFFIDPLIKENYKNKWLTKLSKLSVNLDSFCLDNIKDLSYFGYGLKQDIVGLTGDISQLFYGDCMFSVPECLTQSLSPYYQIVDLSKIKGTPFLLSALGLFSTGNVAQLFFVKEPALIQMLETDNAVRLDDTKEVTDRTKIYEAMKSQAALFKLLGKPFTHMLYYSVVK